MQLRPLHGNLVDLIRSWVVIIAFSACGASISAQDYIEYHRQAIKGYEFRLAHDHHSAIRVFETLAVSYKLLPPEAYALGYSYCVLGDTATAHRYFLLAATLGTSAALLDLDRDPLSAYTDPTWFAAVNKEYFTTSLRLFPYHDGPNPGEPTPTTRINERYQAVIDSLSILYGGYGNELTGHPDALAFYDRTRLSHNAVLDSIMSGQLNLPSIQNYGMNSEFGTFSFHVVPAHLYAYREQLLDWLRKGWIFPRTYANCFDQLDLAQGRPVTYGVLLGYEESDLEPGYQERRAAIGMGSDEVDANRFHWLLP